MSPPENKKSGKFVSKNCLFESEHKRKREQKENYTVELAFLNLTGNTSTTYSAIKFVGHSRVGEANEVKSPEKISGSVWMLAILMQGLISVVPN